MLTSQELPERGLFLRAVWKLNAPMVCKLLHNFVKWLCRFAPSSHSERVPGSTPSWGLSVWSLRVLPVYAWVLSGYSGFLPPSKNMHVRLIGDSKIVLRSECECVCGCLSLLSLCGPVMDWRPVQGVPRLSPDDRWDRLQPPRDPTDGLSGYRKWMDGWFYYLLFRHFQ